MTYVQVCEKLGIDSTIHFVTWERGRVGFTCGKPEEIRYLQRRCKQFGFKMTKSLKELGSW
jgi:hypothetical protein